MEAQLIEIPRRPERRGFAVVFVLEALGIGSVVVDRSGAPLHASSLLEDVLQEVSPGMNVSEFTALFLSGHVIPKSQVDDDAAHCFFIRRTDRRPLVLFSMKMEGGAGNYVLFAAIDFNKGTAPSLHTLRAGFGLTTAESKVALRAACGHSVPQIAKELGLSPGTVRVQLKAVYLKTKTRRQSELAAALARVSVLSKMAHHVFPDFSPQRLQDMPEGA